MSDQPTNPASPTQAEIQQQAQRILRVLCSHMVCLSGELVPLDSEGRPAADRAFFSYTGFVVSLNDEWLFVTAGHVLKGLEEAIRAKHVKILHCCLADHYGEEAKHPVPIPFNIEYANKVYIDDDALGVDVALIILDEVSRRLLETNNIRPIPQENCELWETIEFDYYAVLGFPEELFDRRRWHTAAGATVIGGVRPLLMFGTRVDAAPRYKPAASYPWFALELKDKGEIKSIVGMSGGPILGFHRRPGQTHLYTAVAVQGWWDKERRIAFATSLPHVMSALKKMLRDAQINEEGVNCSTEVSGE
jgi:hypothetical protein